jgi:hypothetical protein
VRRVEIARGPTASLPRSAPPACARTVPEAATRDQYSRFAPPGRPSSTSRTLLQESVSHPADRCSSQARRLLRASFWGSFPKECPQADTAGFRQIHLGSPCAVADSSLSGPRESGSTLTASIRLVALVLRCPWLSPRAGVPGTQEPAVDASREDIAGLEYGAMAH